MILQAKRADVEIIGDNLGEKHSMSLSKEGESHIISMLIERYSDSIGSLIRESVANAIDSSRMSNNSPVIARLIKNDQNNWEFQAIDTGLGLSKEDFFKYIGGVGESTKRDNPNVIGGFGIGSKSAGSYTDSYYYTCRKNGVECKFIIFKNEDNTDLQLIHEKSTTEPNGVIVTVPVKYEDRYDFSNKLSEQLCYFTNLIIDNQYSPIKNNFKIFKSEDFQWSEICRDNLLHISLDDVYYPIDYKKLGIKDIYLPIALKFSLQEGIQPTPSREELQYTSTAKKLILAKLKKVANWFIEKYNSEWKEYDSFLEAYEFINTNNKYITLQGNEFDITDLQQYSDVKYKELTIKDITVKSPKFWWDLSDDFLNNYECIAFGDKGKLKTKKAKHKDIFDAIYEKKKVILVNQVPVGNLRKYLLEKYGYNCLFIKKDRNRYLGSAKQWSHNTDTKTTYRYILNLASEDKKDWRNIIKEFQFIENQIFSNIKDETNCVIPHVWIVDNKAAKKKYGSSGSHKVLNKQEGEVTLAYCRPKLDCVGSEQSNKYTFEKKAIDIQSLSKEKDITIWFKEEEKETAKALRKLIGVKWKICLIGDRESKKIANINQFLTFNQFKMSGKFRKIVTSILFEQVVNEYNNIFDRDDKFIIQELLKHFEYDKNILEEYVKSNVKYIRDNELLDSMIEIAKESQLYDFATENELGESLFNVYLRFKENLEKYSFINLIVKPEDFRNEETKKKVYNLINQVLWVQKTKKGLFEDYDLQLVPKVKEELPILEEQLETV